ncbi:hypothetical protein ABMA58_00200 [Oceanospirillum sp. HFRX-1_2]
MAGREFRTSLVISGDSRGAVTAVRATHDELGRLARQQANTERGTRSYGSAVALAARDHAELASEIDAGTGSLRTWSGVAAGAGVAAATAMAVAQARSAKETQIMADALGMSAGQMSEFAYAAKEQGIEASQSMDLLKDIAEKVGEALKFDGGEGKEALEELGLSAEELVKKSPVDMLMDIGAALEQFDSDAEKSAALEMFGNDLTRLLPLLKDGAAGYRELIQQGRDLNVVLSDADISDMAGIADAFERLADAGTGKFNQMLAQVAPAITSVTDLLAENLDTVGYGVLALSGLLAGRMVSSLMAMVAAMQAARAAAAQQAAADVAAARAAEARAVSALRVAQSEQAAAQRALANARAMTVASQAAYARTRALDALAVANARVTAAEAARAAATVTASRATTVATVAANGLRGVLALFGGPWGLATVAGIAAITYAFHLQEKQAAATANELQRVTALADAAKAKAAEPASMQANLAEEQQALGQLQSQVAETERQMARIRKQLDAGGLPVATVVALSETYSTLQAAVAGADDQIKAHQAEIARLKSGLQSAGVEVEGATGQTSEQSKAVQELIEKLQAQERELKLGERAMLEYQLSQQSATDTQVAAALAAYDSAQALRQKAAADKAAAAEAERAAKAYKNWLDQVRDAADPARKLSEEIEKVNAAVASGDLTEAQGEAYIKKLKEGFKKSADAGEDEFSAMANRVAQTLQDSIASDDWQGVGVAVGAVLAGEIGAAVSKEMAASLEGQMGAQMAGIAGAFGGALVGGALTYLLTSSGTELTDDSGWRQAQQGAGTVLGDIAAQSESIAKATDITAGATESLVGINRDMLRALQSVQAGISGASTLIARDAGNVQFAAFDAPESKFLGAVDSLLTNSVLDVLGGGLLSSALGSFLGGSSKVTDSGIQLSGGSLADLQKSVDVDAYQDTKYKKWKYGSTHRRTDYADVDAGIEAQFSAVFASIADSVYEGAIAIGLAGSDVQKAINEFEIATTEISLKGLSAEEQQKQIQAEFSKIFDGLAADVVPFLDEFQRAGEGMGETLSRVATQVQVADEAAYRLGFTAENKTAEQFARLSDELIQAAGGIEQFISGMSGFIDRFAPDAHRFDLVSSDLSRALSDVGLSVPATRDEMWQLMQTLDAGTESGRAQIAALLDLTDTADAYYAMLEDSGNALTAIVGDAVGADALGQYFSDLSDYISAESAVIESDYRDRIALLQEQGRVAKELQAYTQKLRLSDLSPYDPSDKLAAASDQFAGLLVKAEAGDLEAAAQLQSAADTYLKNADSYYGRTDAYTSVFEDVASALDGLGLDLAAGSSEAAIEQLNKQMLAEQQALTDYAQQELSWAVAQYESLNSIDQLLAALPDEIAAVLSPTEAGDSVVVAPIRPDGSHKTGLARVPWDGYIAELHKGERVLTAPEAQAYNSGGRVDMQPLVAELQQLRAEVAALRSERSADAGKAAQQRTGQQRSLDQVARQSRKPVEVL